MNILEPPVPPEPCNNLLSPAPCAFEIAVDPLVCAMSELMEKDILFFAWQANLHPGL
jgi:hypothetical protein